MSPHSPHEPPPSADERAEDERARQELLELVASGEAVVLVGAGVSIAAGYLPWGEFLDRLASRAGDRPDSFAEHSGSRDYLGYADAIRAAMDSAVGREAYHDELGRLFVRNEEAHRRSIKQIHLDLVQLPFRAFLTTNYDDVLEYALEAARPEIGRPQSVWIWHGQRQHISPALRAVAVADGVRHIIHLHGYYGQPDSIILCRDDYSQAYGIRRLAPPALMTAAPSVTAPPLPPSPAVVGPLRDTNLFLLTTALLLTRRVVFLGFSLDDPYFTYVLKQVCDALWEWGGSVHFAVLPVEPDRMEEARIRARELRDKMGIRAVLYPVINNSHSELHRLIAYLAAEVATRRGGASSASTVGTTVPATGSMLPGRPLPKWARASNEAQLKRIDDRED